MDERHRNIRRLAYHLNGIGIKNDEVIMVRIIIFVIAGVGIVYLAATRLATLPLPDINPDSKVYFIDNLAERMKLLTLKNPEEKIGKLLEYSDEKLEEIRYAIDSEDKSKLLEKVLPKHEKYIEEALEQAQKINLKDELEESDEKNNEDEGSDKKENISSQGYSSGSSGTSWESEISDRVLEKKEVLSEVSSDSETTEEEREIVEKEIIRTETIIERIIEQVEGPIKEIIIYKTENTDEAIEDKEEEEEVQQEQEEKDELSETEKLYYIWINSLYAKTLPKENEPFFMRTHIRRRDNECKFFGGKIVLNINGNEWGSVVAQMQPSDDLWRDLGPIELSAGSYNVEGRLIDNSGQVISTKEFVMLVE